MAIVNSVSAHWGACIFLNVFSLDEKKKAISSVSGAGKLNLEIFEFAEI